MDNFFHLARRQHEEGVRNPSGDPLDFILSRWGLAGRLRPWPVDNGCGVLGVGLSGKVVRAFRFLSGGWGGVVDTGRLPGREVAGGASCPTSPWPGRSTPHESRATVRLPDEPGRRHRVRRGGVGVGFAIPADDAARMFGRPETSSVVPRGHGSGGSGRTSGPPPVMRACGAGPGSARPGMGSTVACPVPTGRAAVSPVSGSLSEGRGAGPACGGWRPGSGRAGTSGRAAAAGDTSRRGPTSADGTGAAGRASRTSRTARGWVRA